MRTKSIVRVRDRVVCRRRKQQRRSSAAVRTIGSITSRYVPCRKLFEPSDVFSGAIRVSSGFQSICQIVAQLVVAIIVAIVIAIVVAMVLAMVVIIVHANGRRHVIGRQSEELLTWRPLERLVKRVEYSLHLGRPHSRARSNLLGGGFHDFGHCPKRGPQRVHVSLVHSADVRQHTCEARDIVVLHALLNEIRRFVLVAFEHF
mmetsp:Transcript_29007/g.48687  ORF Transcript_29007/g.48687 Transcript_29007/m.48687 type:complete len:203 (+) Transcript_29007:92-700(+)